MDDFSEDITLHDLVDVEAFQALMDSFSTLTGIAAGLIDREGNVLVASGWKEMCRVYHRGHPETAARCLESDTVLAENLDKGEPYTIYKCKNGLVDVATPVRIENSHIANLFIGQFLFEPPAIEFFEKQAAQFGFDRAQYLQALADIPVISQEQAKQAIEFLKTLTRVIGSNGLDRKKLLELNRTLEQRICERTAELSYTNERLRVLSEASFEGIVLSENAVIIEANDHIAAIFGYKQAKELIGCPVTDFIASDYREDVRNKVLSEYEETYETVGLKKDGVEIAIEIRGKSFTFDGRQIRGAVIRDLTEKKKAEKEIQTLRNILPICSHCKKVRDDSGYWSHLEAYLEQHSGTQLTHGLCNECMDALYGGQEWYKKAKGKKIDQ